jgi:methionyl-tRNA formyltransferase
VRVVFFGSPEFAAPILEAVADDPAFDIPLVVTQAPKRPSPVEKVAHARGLPVYKPASLRDADSRQPLVEAEADLFLVAAFGLIFRPRTLAIPRLGAVNVHPSLLPRYRGASPIMAAVLNGDRETGVSLMWMDAGIDTGDVISVERDVVARDDTTESLGARLALLGAAQAVRDIPRWVAGELEAQPQSRAGASLTRTLTKADGRIDWTRPAAELERHVRAMWPWPRAWTVLDDALLQIHEAVVVADGTVDAAPGSVLPARHRLVVACGVGALELLTVEPAGRRAMSTKAFLNGRRSPIERFETAASAEPAPPLIVPVGTVTAETRERD